MGEAPAAKIKHPGKLALHSLGLYTDSPLLSLAALLVPRDICGLGDIQASAFLSCPAHCVFTHVLCAPLGSHSRPSAFMVGLPVGRAKAHPTEVPFTFLV